MAWERAAAAAVLGVVGFYCGLRCARLGSLASRVVVAVLVWFSLPVLAAYTVAVALPSMRQLLFLVSAGYVYTLSSLALGWLLASRLGVARYGWTCGEAAAAVLGLAFQNCIFLPLPLVLLAGGPPEYVVAYSVAFNTLIGAVAPLLARRCHGGVGEGLAGVVRGVLLYPPVAATLLGLALLASGPPGPVAGLLSAARGPAALATLLSFYSLGYAAASAWPPRLEARGPVGFVVAWRLAVSPLLHLPLAAAAPDEWARRVLLLEAFMPPATTSIVLSQGLRLAAEVPAAASIVTLPAALAAAAAVLAAQPI